MPAPFSFIALSLLFPCRLFSAFSFFPRPLFSLTRYIPPTVFYFIFLLSASNFAFLLSDFYRLFSVFYLFYFRLSFTLPLCGFYFFQLFVRFYSVFTFIFPLPAFYQLLLLSFLYPTFRLPSLPFLLLFFLCTIFHPSFIGAPVDLSPRKWYNFRKQGKRLFLRRFHPRGI